MVNRKRKAVRPLTIHHSPFTALVWIATGDERGSASVRASGSKDKYREFLQRFNSIERSKRFETTRHAFNNSAFHTRPCHVDSWQRKNDQRRADERCARGHRERCAGAGGSGASDQAAGGRLWRNGRHHGDSYRNGKARYAQRRSTLPYGEHVQAAHRSATASQGGPWRSALKRSAHALRARLATRTQSHRRLREPSA